MHRVKNGSPDLHFEDDWAWVYNSNRVTGPSITAPLCGWLTSAPDEKYTITKERSREERRGEERRGVSNICQHCSCRCQYSVWWLVTWYLILVTGYWLLVSSRLKLNWVVLGPCWLTALSWPVTNMSYLTMQPLAQHFIHNNVSRSITSLWLWVSCLPACLGQPASCLG